MLITSFSGLQINNALLARSLATACLLMFGSEWAFAKSAVPPAENAAEEESPVQVYQETFFNRFNPQTAWDMVQRLPGFTLDSGEDLRGFGGAAGNVLIDSERPSSKVGGIEDALRRIPASQVVRIEVIRGTAGLSEAAGQAVVANVYRRRAGAAGNWELKLERAADGTANPAGELTLARRLGVWDTSTKLNALWERFPLEGWRIQSDANGDLGSSQLEDRPSVLADAFVSSEGTRSVADGLLTLTGRFGRSAFLPNTERLGFDGRLPDKTPDDRLFIDFDSIFVEGELGIDWTRVLATRWSLKILSLSSFQDLEQEQIVRSERPVGQLNTESVFLRLQDSFETIVRGTLSSDASSRFRPEFGGELTYNRLDSRLSLQSMDAGGSSSIALPAANVLVEELRGEVFANAIWQIRQSLVLETGLAAEASEISVSGDASSSQNFTFAKPFATLIFDARPGVQLRLGARHTVGQLDFSEFAASASAEDDRLLAGNPNLGPDQTTRASFTTDMRAERRGALNVEVFHEWRWDVIEQVELSPGFFGAANAGDGRVWGVSANASILLNSIIAGGLIEIEADIRNSSFRDPLTGADRDLSNVESPTILAEFRQDLTPQRLSWGLSYRAARDGAFYFADEESFTNNGEQWSAFIETTRYWDARINFSLRNIDGRLFKRERRFYTPSRAGSFAGSEFIDRERGMFAALTFTRQF